MNYWHMKVDPLPYQRVHFTVILFVSDRGFNRSSPIILYAPGLKCHSQDLPGTSIVRRAYEAGFRSIVVNRRRHTPNSKLSSPRWNLFGDVDDMEQVYWYIKNTFVDKDTPFFLTWDIKRNGIGRHGLIEMGS